MTIWDTLGSLRNVINDELITTILNGLLYNAWLSVEIVDPSEKIIKKLNNSIEQKPYQSLLIHKTTIKADKNRGVIGILIIYHSSDANKEMLETASKLIRNSIDHRVERLLLDRQLKIRDEHTSSINLIFDQLTTAHDTEDLWEKLNYVINQTSQIINAIGGIFLEIRAGRCTIKSSSIYYYNLINQTTDLSPYFLKFLVSKEPKMYNLILKKLGESNIEKAILKSKKTNRTPGGLLIVPVPLDANAEFRMIFILSNQNKNHPLSPTRDDLKLLSSAAGRLTLAYNTTTRIEEQIFITQQKDKLVNEKAEYIHVITHQLIQPLSSLVAYSESVNDIKISIEKRRQLLKWIPSIARYWAGFVYTVAWASRKDEGIFKDSPEVHFKQCKITPMLINCAIDMQPFAQEQQGIHIDVDTKRCELVDRQIQVNLSELQVRQAIMCLIHNAVKYSFAKSKISIKASADSNQLIISIENYGIPIRSEEKETIFNKGGRTDLAIEIDPGGTGLGLFIVREVMELHNGRVTVESKEITQNRYLTIFYLIFPLKRVGEQEKYGRGVK